MNKKILGLDLGTNSIGWALIEQNFEEKTGKILGMGSRIIPMSQDILNNFGSGVSVSQTAERTKFRTARRLRERNLLRRERLHRVLNILGFLPEHYKDQIDFDKRLGKFIEDSEPKVAYKKNWDEIKNKDTFEFIFKTSFEEMLNDFRQFQPRLLINEKGEECLIPYDWTIYYLRRKALTQKIEKEELAWILLNFNQKRGYYQARGEEEDTSGKKEYVLPLRVIEIQKGEKDKKNEAKSWYNIVLENGWIYSATFTTEPQWLNTEKEFLITEELDDKGNIKIVKDKKTDTNGKEKRKITPLPSFEEINLMNKGEQDKIYKKIKARTELTIAGSNKTVGTYIYDTLLQSPKQKIRGKLVRTIERKFYRTEIQQILQKQKEFHPELQNEELYSDCIRELYRNNEPHQLLLSQKDFVYLFIDDILFYQRPLRSLKSSIANCSLEYRKYRDTEGNENIKYLKGIPKSNPYYQEFRIWQWMYNLSIYKKEDNTNVTPEFLSGLKDQENLFSFLNGRKDIEQKPLIKYFLEQKGLKGKMLSSEIEKYRWNYVEDKKYPCNETRTLFQARLDKVMNISPNFLSTEREQQLWHIIYSVTDKISYEKALKSFAEKHHVHIESFVEAFKKTPPFSNEYGSYSEKAIKKLLPLLRIGEYWQWEAIDENTRERIGKIITGEYDESIKERVREKAGLLKSENDFQGLQLWLAQYIVYGRHSEAAITGKWTSADDIEQYLQDFKQHSLRNPIVEQIITETLRVVKDIWQYYGNGTQNFVDEIHIELGREMKSPASDREKTTKKITENENTNLRIKALLAELKNDTSIENVRPYSPMQQEILKIYEDGVLNSEIEIDDDIHKISKTAQPSAAELKRYKLWLEQKYRSPYTGEVIPLSKLFTPEYEIEHIIPQSRYFDDSFNNKVICEAAVNKLKDSQLGYEFIKNHHGEKVQLGHKTAQILEVKDYEDLVKRNYKNRNKRNNLLLDEIPDKMIERQMNDTRYISKFISSVLSNIVRAESADDGVNSKNLIPGNGRITSILKQDWGLNDVWNDLILPRFERMNQLTNSQNYTVWNEKHQKFLPTVPIELSKGFSKKRIDHRHHAMDALIIACATREHINLLNNKYARSQERFDLNRKLRKFEKVAYKDPVTGKQTEREVPKDFLKPWNSFTVDARNALENIVVSFKQNMRIINKATNNYKKWAEKEGIKLRKVYEQNGTNWAIRKPMHKDTVSGKVELPWIKVPKGKILTATRKSLDTSFNEKVIQSITDTGIQKILKNYLASKENNPELAFSPEGIEEMNTNIRLYNDGKDHQPIYKARIFELGSKFPLGQSVNKKWKYVETAKGTNLFFAIYQGQNGKRNFDTIPLNIVIERQKQGLPSVSEINEIGEKLLFYLSPNELVYIPSEEDNDNNIKLSPLNKDQTKRIYKVVSFTGSQIFFVRQDIATSIVNKTEFSSLNKMERALDGMMIKERCIKLEISRLGNIKTLKTNGK